MEWRTRTISELDLDNAVWHFDNNMTYKMQTNFQGYRDAMSVIDYLLELSKRREAVIESKGRKSCPRCGFAVKYNFCSNCGQALKYKEDS